jgi:hypothetical protein
VIEDAARRRDLEEIAGNYDLPSALLPRRCDWQDDGTPSPTSPRPGAVSAVFESDVGLENNPIPIDPTSGTGAAVPERDRELSRSGTRCRGRKAAEVEKRLTSGPRMGQVEARRHCDAAGAGVEVKTANAAAPASRPPAYGDAAGCLWRAGVASRADGDGEALPSSRPR